jgi:YbbR domain-containing protein
MRPNRLFARPRKDVWLLRAVALVISVILWMTVLGGKRIEIAKTIALDYQLPEHLVISNQAPREVSFRVAGPRAFLKEVEERVMSLPIDLRNAQQGDYEVVIRPDMLDLPLGLSVVSVSQQTIPLKLDRAAWKRVPIRAVFGNQLPEGFKVTSVTLKPSTVEIRGPESRLRSIDSVNTEGITLTGDSLTQVFDVNLNLKELPGVQIEDQYKVVNVTINLQGSLSRKWFRKIPVLVRVGDASRGGKPVPAKTYRIRTNPGDVSFLLEGPDPVISDITNQDLEVWAEIPELKEGNYRVRLDWGLPPELRVVRRSTDWVEVVVPRRR